MRRSICYCEPSYALAGQVKTWSFIHTTSIPIPKGSLLKFDLLTDGRAIDWQAPNAAQNSSANSIYMLTPSDKVLYAKEIPIKDKFVPQYEFVLSENMEVGDSLTIVIGTPYGKTPTEKSGNRAQCTTQRRKNFHLYVDTSGKGHYSDPEIFSLDIRGNVLKTFASLSPLL